MSNTLDGKYLCQGLLTELQAFGHFLNRIGTLGDLVFQFNICRKSQLILLHKLEQDTTERIKRIEAGYGKLLSKTEEATRKVITTQEYSEHVQNQLDTHKKTSTEKFTDLYKQIQTRDATIKTLKEGIGILESLVRDHTADAIKVSEDQREEDEGRISDLEERVGKLDNLSSNFTKTITNKFLDYDKRLETVLSMKVTKSGEVISDEFRGVVTGVLTQTRDLQKGLKEAVGELTGVLKDFSTAKKNKKR